MVHNARRLSIDIAPFSPRSASIWAGNGIRFNAAMFFIMMFLWCLVGKDLLANPVRDGTATDPYGVVYQNFRYLQLLIVIAAAISAGPIVAARAIMMSRHIWPFMLVCILSTFVSDDPYWTARACLICVGFFFIAGFCIERLGPTRIMILFLYFLAMVLVASTALAIALPDIGRHSALDATALVHAGEWRGIFGYKTALGAYASFGAVLFFTHGRMMTNSKYLLWTVRVCAVLCLVLCKSSNALAGSAVMICVYFIMRPRRPVSFGLLAISLILTITVLSFLPTVVANVLGRDATFTGRTEIWAKVIEVTSDNLIFGFGYAVGNGTIVSALMSGTFDSAVDPHNAYLAVMVDLGLVGVLALLIAIWQAFRYSYTSVTTSDGTDRLASIGFMMILLASCAMAIAEVWPFSVQGNGGPVFCLALIAARSSVKLASVTSVMPAQALPRQWRRSG